MGKQCNDFAISRMYCVRCGQEGVPIFRKAGKYREAGHLKKLYCLNCGRVWNHIEIRQIGNYTYDDFVLEKENGNFDARGNRKEPYKIFKHHLIQAHKEVI